MCLSMSENMKTIFITIFIIFAEHICSQNKLVIDKYVKSIDSLFITNGLTTKEYPGRTFAGSLNGYYNHDTLVYINTLTDGEYGGIETKYYVQDTIIYKVFIMTASFKSPEEWSKYYKQHKANINCDICHNKKQCDKTTIFFTNPWSVESTRNEKPLILSPAQKTLHIYKTAKSFESLYTLLRKI